MQVAVCDAAKVDVVGFGRRVLQIRKAIGDYLSLSQNTTGAIAVINAFFGDGRIPAHCRLKPLSFLQDLRSTSYSLDQQIAFANFAFENVACGNATNPCQCFEVQLFLAKVWDVR